MKVKLKIWRQQTSYKKGSFVSYEIDEVSKDMSFLEILDLLNETLVRKRRSLLSLIMTVERASVEVVVW